tara:strand:- start:602 stop:1396 length:795 start_codon:yes stop_codon:yes gene_type:complete
VRRERINNVALQVKVNNACDWSEFYRKRVEVLSECIKRFQDNEHFLLRYIINLRDEIEIQKNNVRLLLTWLEYFQSNVISFNTKHIEYFSDSKSFNELKIVSTKQLNSKETCCPICYEEWGTIESCPFTVTLHCGHIFCATCLYNWSGNTCPECREFITFSKLSPLRNPVIYDTAVKAVVSVTGQDALLTVEQLNTGGTGWMGCLDDTTVVGDKWSTSIADIALSGQSHIFIGLHDGKHNIVVWPVNENERIGPEETIEFFVTV